jgi:hypothetical protein
LIKSLCYIPIVRRLLTACNLLFKTFTNPDEKVRNVNKASISMT